MPTDPISGPSRDSDFTDQSRKPTAASAWKDAPQQSEDDVEGFITELPSGNVVLMTRNVNLALMLQTGQIPNPLAGIVQRMIDSGAQTFSDSQVNDAKAMVQLLDLVHKTIVTSVLDPKFDMPPVRGTVVDPETGKKITETPEEYQDRINDWEADPEKVSVFRLTSDDRWYIFSVAQGAAANLASFREQQNQFVADLSTEQGVRKPTKRTGGTGSKKKK